MHCLCGLSGMSGMADTLKILLIEDDAEDCRITREVIDAIPGRSFDLEWWEDYDSGYARLERGGVDICFVDYEISDRSGLDFIRMARDAGHLTPLVLLTAVAQHDIDAGAMEAGASDYLDKSELSARMVERTIRHSMAHSESMKAMAAQSGLLSMTLENARAGIAALDVNGTCVAINSHFDAMLDAIVGVPRGKAARCPDATAMLIDQIAEQLDSAAGESVEVKGIEGAIYEVTRNKTPLHGSVFVSMDVTGQRILQQELYGAKQYAEAARLATSSFFTNLSHELRTPLHGIIGFSELILNDPAAKETSEYATHINECGRSLLTVVNTVISFSRIESGLQSFSDEKILDLSAFIAEVLRTLEACATDAEVRLEVAIDERIGGLVFDPMALRTMLLNLVDNAIRFSSPDSVVTIRASLSVPDEIVRLSVIDTGIGIPRDKQRYVFEAFYQVDSHLSRSYEGIGLGLPLVKLLAEAHGGAVDLVSEEGVGTNVSIIIPDLRLLLADFSNQRIVSV